MQELRIEVAPDRRQNTSGQRLTDADVNALTELAKTTETNCHTVITRPGSPRDLRYGWTYRDLNRDGAFGAWAIHADGEMVWAQITITGHRPETPPPEHRRGPTGPREDLESARPPTPTRRPVQGAVNADATQQSLW